MIDAHAHVVPLELPFGASGDPRWPTVEPDGDRGRVMIAGEVFRVIDSTSWDLDRRAEELRATGTSHQTLSPMPELFSYWAPPAEGEVFCRRMNEWLVAATEHDSFSYDAFGIAPLQDVGRAVTVARAAKEIGLTGIEVGTRVGDVPIADPGFRPFLEACEELELVVFVHSFHPNCGATIEHDQARMAAALPHEVGCAAAELIATGRLSETPGLRVLVSHGGGTLAFALPRLSFVWHNDESFRTVLPEPPLDVARRLYYDTLTFSGDALRHLVELVGDERVLIGSDYPFLKAPIGWTVDEAGFSAEVDHRLRVANATDLLGLAGPP
jgi:aminocarboxymuconate-semialdehyde decarboxylase